MEMLLNGRISGLSSVFETISYRGSVFTVLLSVFRFGNGNGDVFFSCLQMSDCRSGYLRSGKKMSNSSKFFWLLLKSFSVPSIWAYTVTSEQEEEMGMTGNPGYIVSKADSAFL